MARILFPAEWYKQSGVAITWPHAQSDWASLLEKVIPCYLSLSREILKREKLLVVVPEGEDITSYFTEKEQRNLITVAIPSNDTWTRDYAPLTLFIDQRPTLVDFGFNAWGLKFPADKDNQITGILCRSAVFQHDLDCQTRLDFILEGGSIESDGAGTLLTTSATLLAPNRNQPMSREDIEITLKELLGAKRVLWLNHGYLAGDDTDSHIDTLARFCDEDTIAYVACDDAGDEHYDALKAMEQQLQSWVTIKGAPYHLIPLPMADACYDDNHRLPATYANFVIINGAVLMPTYGTVRDEIARQQLEKAFPEREVVGVDARVLIQQHGSLHCATMQFPEGVL